MSKKTEPPYRLRFGRRTDGIIEMTIDGPGGKSLPITEHQAAVDLLLEIADSLRGAGGRVTTLGQLPDGQKRGVMVMTNGHRVDLQLRAK